MTKKKVEKKESKSPWLFFIDTNILLDFYRQGGEAAKTQLDLIDKHKDRLITSEQVRMEYLKNRQNVLYATIGEYTSNLNATPSLIAMTEEAESYEKAKENLTKEQKTLKKHLTKLLENPEKHDEVFKSLLKIWKNPTDIHLSRDRKIRFDIRKLAEKRRLLGYPPNKDNSAVLGDAIHWEWIIHCAITHSEKPNIIIVSNDNDFGKKGILNDWLKREFSERVAPLRKIELTNKISDAVEKINIVDAEKLKEVEVVKEFPFDSGGAGSMSQDELLVWALTRNLAVKNMKDLSESKVASGFLEAFRKHSR